MLQQQQQQQMFVGNKGFDTTLRVWSAFLFPFFFLGDIGASFGGKTDKVARFATQCLDWHFNRLLTVVCCCVHGVYSMSASELCIEFLVL